MPTAVKRPTRAKAVVARPKTTGRRPRVDTSTVLNVDRRLEKPQHGKFVLTVNGRNYGDMAAAGKTYRQLASEIASQASIKSFSVYVNGEKLLKRNADLRIAPDTATFEIVAKDARAGDGPDGPGPGDDPEQENYELEVAEARADAAKAIPASLKARVLGFSARMPSHELREEFFAIIQELITVVGAAVVVQLLKPEPRSKAQAQDMAGGGEL
jgi:hypothetical protein